MRTGFLLGFFFLFFSLAHAESLLTGVLYTEGSATYSLFDVSGAPLAGPIGGLPKSLHSGMSLSDLTRIDTSGDAMVMLSPLPQVKYLLYPRTLAVNEFFRYNKERMPSSFDYRIRMLAGRMVGEVNVPKNIYSEVDTPPATVSTLNGRFLVEVRPDGGAKYAVMAGTVDVRLKNQKAYLLAPGQVLNVSASGESMGPLNLDAEAAKMLTSDLPKPNADRFTDPPLFPGLDLLDDEASPFINPANMPNPVNTENNPPISPTTP